MNKESTAVQQRRTVATTPLMSKSPGRERTRPVSHKPLWVLLGRRAGDNNQLLAVAECLGLPYEIVRLDFRGKALPNMILGASLFRVRNADMVPMGGPEIVLSIGRRSPPVARWIQKQSGGATKLVHFGRPWGRTNWFDLVVTTPQYGVSPAPNVLCNMLPFCERAGTDLALDKPPPELGRLPRPWNVVLVGGRSRPYVMNKDAVLGLASAATELAEDHGGSIIVVPSPRTPADCIERMRSALSGQHHVFVPGAKPNPYQMLLNTADRFLVTCDSASMIAEALSTSKPVELFVLPRNEDWRLAAVAWWRSLAERSAIVRSGFRLLREWGLVNSVRDLPAYHAALEAHGAFGERKRGVDLAGQCRAETLLRIRSLLE